MRRQLGYFRFSDEVGMALIFPGKTKCSICGNVIMEDDDIVATTHFIGDENDPLWQYSDSAMHRSCFFTWNQRDAFVAKFNQIVSGVTFGNGTYHVMESDGTITVLQRGE